MTNATLPTLYPPIHDLVLDPYTQYETLSHSLRVGALELHQADYLATVLPQAVNQLDAIGDLHGALALATLQDELAHSLNLV